VDAVKKDSAATEDTKDDSNTVRKLLVESMLKSVQEVLKQREQDQQPGKNCRSLITLVMKIVAHGSAFYRMFNV